MNMGLGINRQHQRSASELIAESRQVIADS